MSEPSKREKLFNVVLFGETGAGKSSLINMLAGSDTAVTSNKAVGCTTTSTAYDIRIKNTPFRFWDTAGLNETDSGTVSSSTALDQLGQLLESLNGEDGICLLLYCVAGVGFRAIMRVNYDLVWGIMCQMQIPVLVVVTKQEHATTGNQWWTEHQSDLKYKFPKDPHGTTRPKQDGICVTTTRGKNNLFDEQYKRSTDEVQTEILKLATASQTMAGKIEPKWLFSEGETRKMAQEYLTKFRKRTKKERSVLKQIDTRLQQNAKRKSSEDKSPKVTDGDNPTKPTDSSAKKPGLFVRFMFWNRA